MSERPSSLDGVRVLDLTRVLAGPFCTQILADHGAEVWKVEKPGEGDDTRAFGPPFVGGESTYFLSINRNKRSLAIDLKDPRGLDLVRQLAGHCDVVVENFRPGAAQRLGLGADQLRALHPRLIYCSISGFGQTGPDRDRAGYDLAIQGLSGLQSLTGAADGPPTKVGTSIADLVSGLYAVQGILLALVRRERTGQGETIDVAMLDSVLSLLTYQASSYLHGGRVPMRAGNRHPSIAPYETFAAGDGYLNLAVGNDAQWHKLCGLLQRQDLRDDPRFVSNPQRVANRDALFATLTQVFAQDTVSAWLIRLQAAGVPCGPILDVGQALEQPSVQAREMVVPLQHPTAGPIRVPGVAVKLSEAPGRVRTPPPRLGEQTDAVLTEVLSLAPHTLTLLREAGVIA
jgi:formyl-CoA transferase